MTSATRSTVAWSAFLVLALTTSVALAAPPARPAVVVVKAGRVIDGGAGAPRRDQAIVIEGGRIARVAPLAGFRAPAGARVIDLSNAVVLPGLIDCHVHLAARPDKFDDIDTFRTSPQAAAMVAVKHAEATLAAGFTTVRDLGSPPFVAVDLRELIAEGVLRGPRIIASGPALSMTGGHGDLNGYPPAVAYEDAASRALAIADGPDEVRKAVRAQLRRGVDVVKVMATGGVFSRGDTLGAAQYTVAELRVAVEEAHRAGKKVAAHAHGAEGIRNAIAAGVDSIEHATFIDAAGVAAARRARAILVPDVYNHDYIMANGKALGIPAEYLRKEAAVGDTQRLRFAAAVKRGAAIAFGSDAGIFRHGDNARQFATMVRYGMSPASALRAATSIAAAVVGDPDLGRIGPGAHADLIAVTGDPLRDVRVLEQVGFVMKGGEVVKDELSRR